MRCLSLVLLTGFLLSAQAADPVITWKKTVLDQRFRSEGVAAADVNKDGKKDVLNGEYWYEAPDWKKHEMQPPMDHGNQRERKKRLIATTPRRG